jgi:uncharacterized protein with GYD domain
MPAYMMLTTLTDEGRTTLRAKPARIKEVNKEIEAMGMKVLTQYALLGPYDFVNIIEAPDNQSMARLAMELGFRGTIQVMTLPAIPIDEFVATLEGD